MAENNTPIPAYLSIVNSYAEEFISAVVDAHIEESAISLTSDRLFAEIRKYSPDNDISARICNDTLICISSRLMNDFGDNKLIKDFLLKEYHPDDISPELSQSEIKTRFQSILMSLRQIVSNAFSASSSTVGTVNYLLKTQCSNVTLQFVADYLNISASYLSLIFKEKAGCNFRTYVHKYRMQKASQYLLSSNMTINQIATALGYNDVVNFSRIFKKYYSLSPSDYRLNNSTDDTL